MRHKLTFYEEYGQPRLQTEQEEVINTARSSVGIDGRTHTIRPAQCSAFHVLLTTRPTRVLNASWRRWTKAVERVTLVPKCLPTKKRMLRTCVDRNVAVSVGKETAARRRV